MDKQEILVIECISSACMYVEEIIERGYKALVINPICGNQHVMDLKHKFQAQFERKYSPDEYECIYAQSNSEDIFNACRGHNVICAVAGSEYGVKFTDEVAFKLGVPGNDPRTTNCRCTKRGMVESLEKAGIRAIKTVNVKSDQDIIDFYQKNNIKVGFMKFSEGAGSFGNKACEGVQDALDYYHQLKSGKNYFGTEDDILLQEFIEGPEYVVNTVSCKGNHRITDMWKYDKVVNDAGDTLYNTSTLIESVTDEVKDMVDYALKVLDAVDVKYGPVHAEYKIDHNGPVLIETNCRPMGDSTTRDYATYVTGNCIVDWALDSYIDEAKFSSHPKEYHSARSAIKKYVILKDDLKGDMASGQFIAEHLKTFHNHNDYDANGITDYVKTHDLSDTPMIIKFASDNKKDIEYDVSVMREIEDNYIELFISPTPNLCSGKQANIEEITLELKAQDKNVERADEMTRTLVLTKEDAFEVCNGTYCRVGNQTPKIFDQVMYADARDATLLEKFEDMCDMLEYLKPGGKALLHEEVAKVIPYGQKAFDVLVKVFRV